MPSPRRFRRPDDFVNRIQDLQRLRFPLTAVEVPLYAQPGPGIEASARCCNLRRGAELSLDSFFNACFIGGNGWPFTLASNLSCNLILEGDVRIRLFVREGRGRERTVFETDVYGSVPDEPVSIPFEAAAPHGEPYRVFPRITALSESATVHGGSYGCSAVGNAVTLGLVICTYRREREAVENAERLAMETDGIRSRCRIVMVDNGGTIDPERLPEGVTLVRNRNLGGAGGFSRGLLELLEERGCSHVVLMDDDIQLDTECILRCLNHFHHRPEGPAIAGVLLDEETPQRVQEAGAWLRESGSPLVVRPGLVGADLAEASTLDTLSDVPRPDYGGFWFFAFPLSTVRHHLLLPFFLKGDDVEFGLRLRQNGIGCTLLPGVGVRHPGFLDSFDMIKRYYWVRNMLAVEMLHGHRSALSLTHPLFIEACAERRRRRTEHLAALVHGMDDFLKGPEWLERADNGRLVSSLKKEQIRLAAAVGGKASMLLFLQAVLCCLKIACTARRLRMTWRGMASCLASTHRWKERCSP